MGLDAVVERFIKGSPVTVMMRLTLQRALDSKWMDALFDEHSERQYVKELLFSTQVELMSLVAVGMRPSLHAAAKEALEDGRLPVSITALYDKVNGTEPGLVRALVAGSAQRLTPVLAEMETQPPVSVPGYRVLILDGNHLAASEKRLKPLRGFAGTALPGPSLVIYDPDLGMVIDRVPCEDGHTSERALMGPLLAAAGPGDLILADRNFCTRPILSGLHQKRACFLVREHGANPNPVERGLPKKIGRVDTGMVYEQAVAIKDDAGNDLILRRIELRLRKPTEDGDTVIRLLSNVHESHLSALELAQLYRRRWRIESMFQRLESVLQSEIPALGNPRAALFAFGVAVVTYNVLALITRAISIQLQLDASKIQISPYYLANEIKITYHGMMMATDEPVWQRYDQMSTRELAQTLLRIAARVNPRKLRSHPRGPKVKNKKNYVSRAQAQRHVATSRVLKEGIIK